MNKEKLQKLEKELNIEYEKVGNIEIRKAHEDTILLSEIEYVNEIMEVISPLEIDKPVIVSETYHDTYKIIDGYHRIKNKILNKELNVDVIILDEYNIERKNDTLFSFLETLTGKTIKFLRDNLLLVDNKHYQIEENEGCGGCSSGWSIISVLPEFINKEIEIKTIKQVFEKETYSEESDEYDLFINDKKIADVDTGWGNGYYGGDFEIKLIN